MVNRISKHKEIIKSSENATTSRTDKPGLSLLYTYCCARCKFVWLPKDVEILKTDTLVNREPPTWCARCKSKSWRKRRRGNVSVSRIRALLREGKDEYAIAVLSLASEKNKDAIIKRLEEDGYPILDLTTIETSIELIKKTNRALGVRV